MIAKLRVGWTVADCAPGVRTIIRSVLFHWITGFRVCAGLSSGFWAVSASEAAFAKLARTERLAHKSKKLSKSFFIVFSPSIVFRRYGLSWRRHFSSEAVSHLYRLGEWGKYSRRECASGPQAHRRDGGGQCGLSSGPCVGATGEVWP